MALCADFVQEACAASGTADYNLTGPPSNTPYVSFVRAFGTGAKVFYVVQSDTSYKWEIGWGIVTDASPDTLTRNVLASWDLATLSTSAKISWTGSDGALRAYCAPVAPGLLGALTLHRGTTAPAYPIAGMVWMDTTTATAVVIKQYDGSGWIAWPFTINETADTAPQITLTSTDTGATTGPFISKYWNSASPAVNDEATLDRFTFRNTTPADKVGFESIAKILDTTPGNEDIEYLVKTIMAGSLTQQLGIANGLTIGSPSGSYKGTGTLNLNSLYLKGLLSGGLVQLPSTSLAGLSVVDTAFDPTLYRAILFVYDAIVMTSDGANLLARMSIDSGSNFITTAASYNAARGSADSTPSTNAAGGTDTSINVAPSVDSTTAQNLSGIGVLLIGGAAAHATKLVNLYGYQTGATIAVGYGYGSNSTASQVNALRYLPSTSTFASGSLHPLGILK